MSAQPRLRIGSRGSALALIQAREVRARLAAAHPELAAEDAIAIEVIKTTGDLVLDRPLTEIGGKGLFVKEIETALLDGAIDLAVHSMKDMEAWLPPGLIIPCLLPREDPRDALIARHARSLADLAPGARVGTASPRRAAQLLMRRPDLEIVSLRGNVETRLRKIAEGEAEATLLAISGLKRLGRADAAAAVLEIDEMLPAIAQGAIGVECRADDKATQALLAPLNDGATWTRVSAERALLAAIGGSCQTPIAALAELVDDGHLFIQALLVTPDGRAAHAGSRHGPSGQASRLGAELGMELREKAGPGFFADEAGTDAEGG